MSVLKAYQDALIRRGYQSDPEQLSAVQRLERMHDELVQFKEQRSNRIKRLINRPDVPRGVWLHGGVGRGKSFLMDCFITKCRSGAKFAFIFMSSCAAFIMSWTN